MKKIAFSVGGFVFIIGIVLIAIFFYRSNQPPPKPVEKTDPLIPYLFLNRQISANKFHQFLTHCNSSRLTLILDSVNKKRDTKIAAVTQIKEEFIWQTSHWSTYIFKNKENIPYGDIVKWTAQKIGIPDDKIAGRPTFTVERMIFEHVFAQIWDKLDAQQRQELLRKMKIQKSQWPGITALTGGAALAALKTTLVLTGFSFYTGMSSALAAAVGMLGVTLPFTIYTTASSLVAAAGGPIGWTLGGIALASGAWLCGGANPNATAQMIIQIHCIKVDALNESHLPLPNL